MTNPSPRGQAGRFTAPASGPATAPVDPVLAGIDWTLGLVPAVGDVAARLTLVVALDPVDGSDVPELGVLEVETGWWPLLDLQRRRSLPYMAGAGHRWCGPRTIGVYVRDVDRDGTRLVLPTSAARDVFDLLVSAGPAEAAARLLELVRPPDPTTP